MNERIRELVKQAGGRFSTHTLTSYPAQHRESIELWNQNIEKFAELIVRECVKLCEHESNDDEYDQYDMGMSVKAEDIKVSIMKTFGVK